MNQEKLLKSLHTLDYAVAGGTIGYGLFTQSVLITSLGILGLVLAKLNIADKLSNRIKRMFQRKKPPIIPELSDNLAELSSFGHSGAAEVLEVPRRYGHHGLRIGPMAASTSRHNRLVDVAAFNHVA